MRPRAVFEPEMRINQIVLVGVGGTGSHLARSVARIIYDLKARDIDYPNLLFVDPDQVEMKNVGRQMFTAADVGEYKAEILARRFSRALGIPIEWRNDPLDKHWFEHAGGYHRNSPKRYGDQHTIWLGAVDNHQARATLAQLEGTWIDCGNHFSSGQVVIGNTHDRKQVKAFKRKEEIVYRHLPTAALLFPQLLEPEPENTAAPDLSCADLVSIGEQHLLVNDLVASIAAQYVYKLLHRQPIHSFMTFVDLDGISMRSIPITHADLKAYLPQEEVA